MKQIFKSINNSLYPLLVLGILILSMFIWFRFIRERIIQNIPFTLTIISLIGLIFICCIYIYTIIRIIKPKAPHTIIQKILPYIQPLVKPLLVLDAFLKNNVYIKNITYTIFKYLPSLLKYNKYEYNRTLAPRRYHIEDDTRHNLKLLLITYGFYCLFNIIPSIILLMILCIDIFYFNKIEIFYSWIGLTILPLLYMYMLRSIPTILESFIQYLDTWYKVEIIAESLENIDEDLHYMPIELLTLDWDCDLTSEFDIIKQYLKPKKFIEYQTEAIIWDYKPYIYRGVITWALVERYDPHLLNKPLLIADPEEDLNEDIKNKIKSEFYELMPLVLIIQIFMKYHPMPRFQKLKPIHKVILLAINGGYLICWLYILLISLHSFLLSNINVMVLILLNALQTMQEPFSDTYLFDISSATEPNIDDYLIIITLSIGIILLIYWYNIYSKWENDKN